MVGEGQRPRATNALLLALRVLLITCIMVPITCNSIPDDTPRGGNFGQRGQTQHFNDSDTWPGLTKPWPSHRWRYSCRSVRSVAVLSRGNVSADQRSLGRLSVGHSVSGQRPLGRLLAAATRRELSSGFERLKHLCPTILQVRVRLRCTR